MAEKTKFIKLTKPGKGTKNWASLVDGNFDLIDTEFKRQNSRDAELDDRITNLVTQTGDSNSEIVDARHSTLVGKAYDSLGARLNYLEKKNLAELYDVEKSDMDINGIYTRIKYFVPDGSKTLYLESYVSGQSPNYENLTWVFYDEYGEIDETFVWNLEYDTLGELVSRTLEEYTNA